jgi:protein-tyrosine phosphatase
MGHGITPGESIAIPSVPNLRDLGGWPTKGSGRVRAGLLYRSTDLHRLAGDDLAAVEALGIRTVFDLRTEAERTAQPDRLPPGAELVVVDVLADSSGAAPAQLMRVLGDPVAAAEMLGDGKAVKLFEHGYREVVSLPSALAAYRTFFSDLARPEHRPALFHCTTGKDRTGWGAAAMLMLLGVSDEDVMRDYLLTNAQLVPAMQPVFDRFQAAGGDPDLLRPVIGVQEEYLEASLDEMRRRYGSIEGYFADGLQFDAGARQAVVDAFVEPDFA